jgi:starvation-inducible DNA-binding protein
LATPAERPNPPFPDDVADEIGKQLQLTLAELIALSLAGQQLHWNAYGREFLSDHRHLDLVVDLEGAMETYAQWIEAQEPPTVPPEGSG